MKKGGGGTGGWNSGWTTTASLILSGERPDNDASFQLYLSADDISTSPAWMPGSDVSLPMHAGALLDV